MEHDLLIFLEILSGTVDLGARTGKLGTDPLARRKRVFRLLDLRGGIFEGVFRSASRQTVKSRMTFVMDTERSQGLGNHLTGQAEVSHDTHRHISV